LITLFDTREPHHAASKAFLQRSSQSLLTVDAVLVEITFFLRGEPRRAFLNAVAASALPNCLPNMPSWR
jgi:predicted nucleic acid-binding protein